MQFIRSTRVLQTLGVIEKIAAFPWTVQVMSRQDAACRRRVNRFRNQHIDR